MNQWTQLTLTRRVLAENLYAVPQYLKIVIAFETRAAWPKPRAGPYAG